MTENAKKGLISTNISIEWTDTGCKMHVDGNLLPCPVCGAFVGGKSGDKSTDHLCGDQLPKKSRRKKAAVQP